MAGSRLLSLGTKGAYSGLSNSVLRATSTASDTYPLWSVVFSKTGNPQQLVQDLLNKEAVEIVRETTSPAFYSLLFVVPKASGQWRPIIDLSTLNTFVDIPTFSHGHSGAYKTLSDTRQLGNFYRSAGRLPADSYPCISSEVSPFHVRPPSLPVQGTPVRAVNVTLDLYDRDGGSKEDASSPRHSDFHVFGRLANSSRDQTKVCVPHSNSETVMSATRVSHQRQEVHVRTDATVRLPRVPAGSATIYVLPHRGQGYESPEDVSTAVVSARSHSSSMAGSIRPSGSGREGSALRETPFPGVFVSSPASLGLQPSHKPAFVATSQDTVEELSWWTQPHNIRRGMAIQPPEPQVHILTDASQEGWGGHWVETERRVAGKWRAHQCQRHINWLEMKAIHLVIQLWCVHLTNQTVLLECDNSTTVSYLNKQGGTRSRQLSCLTLRILTLCDGANILLRLRHIPGKRNVLADRLSRGDRIVSGEWALNPVVFRLITGIWGTPQVDLFATRGNRQLPVYVSPYPDPEALSVDAMSMSWKSLWAYAFPPYALLPAILHKILQDQADIVLIAPLWPEARWFAKLLEMVVDVPRQLPARPDLLHQGIHMHHNPDNLRLHAFRLSGQPSRAQAFRKQLPRERPGRSGNPPWLSMNQSGGPLFLGAIGKRWIPSRPLLPR